MLTMLVLMCLISVSNADLKYQLPILYHGFGELSLSRLGTGA